jgi:hypothetical protein
MLKRNYLVASLILAVLVVLWAATVQAAPVGTFLQVEGQVDLLKGGKLPATPVKVQDGVEVGDVVRTKSESRAQIKFVDDTVLTIAPESRVTVEEYMFDGATGERKAVLGVLRGLVHTAVEKVTPDKEPDFIMKTQTAVLGVRGTKWYTKLLPNATDVYTEASKLEVKNLLPEYPGVVLMGTLQYVRVGTFMNPTIPVNITKEDLKPLTKQMKFGIGATSQTDLGPIKAMGVLGPPQFYTTFGLRTYVDNIWGGFYVPRFVESRLYFVMTWTGSWYEFFNSNGLNGEILENGLNVVLVSSYGWGSRSTFFANGFMSEFIGAFRASESYMPIYGEFTARATGWYRPGPAGRLIGTIQVTFTPTPYYNGQSNVNGSGFLSEAITAPSLQSSPNLRSLGSMGIGESFTPASSSVYRATLSGPFVFNPEQQILRAPLSGPYTQPDGQRYNLRGILIQTPGEGS